MRLPGPHRMFTAASCLGLILAQGACNRGEPGDDLPPLVIAILENDHARIASLVTQGADPSAVVDVASAALIDRGIEVETGQRVVLTPLLVAAHVGDQEVVRLLLAHHADPNLSTPDGITPLLVAVDADHEGVVDLLLAAGADPAVTAGQGPTPMYTALRRGNAEVIAVLQRHGVPLDSRDPIVAGATIDTSGIDPEVQVNRFEATRLPMGIAVDADAAKVYWSEYGTGRIRRVAIDGGAVETVVEDAGDGPIGISIAADADRICWTGDGSFPRFVRCSNRAGQERHTVALGPIVNRPRAIAATASDVFWTETINGRLRRARQDEAGVIDLFVDGISSRGDRPDAAPFFSLGLAVAPATGRLFWSDFHGEVIGSMLADGSGRKSHFDAADGVDFPVGVAVDRAGDSIFWVDVAKEAILRASVRGVDPEVVVDAADGLIEPRAIALDEQRKRIYWTDVTREAIGRASFDGASVEWLPLDRGDAVDFGPLAVPRDCRAAIHDTAATFLGRAVKRVAVCLEKVDAAKSVKRRHDDARHAVRTCLGQLVTLAESGRDSLAPQMEALRKGVCRDVGIEPAAVLAGCGASSAACSMTDCAISACRKQVWTTVARKHLRAAEWLEEIRPFVAEQAGTGADEGREARLALGVVDEIVDEIVDGIGAGEPQPRGGGSLPATGLLTSYRAVRRGNPEQQPVPDDAALRAGMSLRFRDNRDGTVSDLTTGLMWEKKCDGCDSLHAESLRYLWSSSGAAGVIWDWIDRVNLEGGTGFAGYDDWRIPNVKELQSIVDYERFNPSVTRAFDGDHCGIGCSDLNEPACSCSSLAAYWSSTTFADGPDRAFVVTFNLGLVGDFPKDGLAAVRAVRGGPRVPRHDTTAASPGPGGS